MVGNEKRLSGWDNDGGNYGALRIRQREKKKKEESLNLLPI